MLEAICKRAIAISLSSTINVGNTILINNIYDQDEDNNGTTIIECNFRNRIFEMDKETLGYYFEVTGVLKPMEAPGPGVEYESIVDRVKSSQPYRSFFNTRHEEY